MLRSHLLIYMLQGSLALTCYNSTRVSESHKIEYKSHETSEQACADACTANDKCIAYLSNDNGGIIECVQFGPAKEIMCTLPIFINMKVACPPGIVASSLCIPQQSVLLAKKAEETFLINDLRLPKSVDCTANNCKCGFGQFMVVGFQGLCVSVLRFEWEPLRSEWRSYGTLNEASAYLGKSDEFLHVRCETLPASLGQRNYSLPFVSCGFYGEKEIVCRKGIKTVSTTVMRGITNASPDALRGTDEKGFVVGNDRLIRVYCNP